MHYFGYKQTLRFYLQLYPIIHFCEIQCTFYIQQYRNKFCYTIFNKCLVLRMPRQQKQYLTLHCKVAKHCTLLSQITLRKKFLRFTYLYFGSHEHFSSVPTVFQTLDVACDFFCMVMKISHFLFIS